ncbi:MAG: hypothetical protein IJ176_01320 [Prevotella sp.]|nr:hypothetical protein [Prevotella sp.]
MRSHYQLGFRTFSESEKRQPSAGARALLACYRRDARNFSKLIQNFSYSAFIFAILFNFVSNFEKFPAEGGSIRDSLNKHIFSGKMMAMSKNSCTFAGETSKPTAITPLWAASLEPSPHRTA